jgi:hypothetical protein
MNSFDSKLISNFEELCSFIKSQKCVSEIVIIPSIWIHKTYFIKSFDTNGFMVVEGEITESCFLKIPEELRSGMINGVGLVKLDKQQFIEKVFIKKEVKAKMTKAFKVRK